MSELNIKDYINRELSSADREIALKFVTYLEDNNLIFYKDNCDCWKDKIFLLRRSGRAIMTYDSFLNRNRTGYRSLSYFLFLNRVNLARGVNCFFCVFGVEIRSDFFGVFGCKYRSPYHNFAWNVFVMQKLYSFLH